MTNLDVSTLPRQLLWNPGTPAQINLGATVYQLRTTIDHMMALGLIAPRVSFGFAMATPNIDLTQVWDDPAELIGLVVGWGPEGDRYIANACRKIRAAAREGEDTEILRLNGGGMFRDIVTNKEGDTEFEWGDFPFDGAAHSSVQGRARLDAVSAFPKEQDPVIARLIGGHIGLAMHYSDQELTAA